MQQVFENKTRLGNKFYFKDRISKDLSSGVVFWISVRTCNESYYGECVRYSNVRFSKINISPLNKKQVKSKNSSAVLHLLFCYHLALCDNFVILPRENKMFLLQLKESLLIMKDQPSLNRNITSTPLYLFVRFY